MVIVLIREGLGNQFFQYACARCFAHNLGTELKIACNKVLDGEKPKFHNYYKLMSFNILENIATPEEIKHVQETGIVPKSMKELKELKNVQDDVFIAGSWMFDENYIESIIDIIRKEFTLKEPFSPNAETWKQKILSSECSVSMHLRHGDKVYNPKIQQLHQAWTVTLPLDYYYTCINILKQRYSNLTVFVFSDDIQWCKENLRLDVPTEFIEGCKTDAEEWVLIGLCKHNICANSTFSRSAMILNSNPDKKVFFARPSNLKEVNQFINSLTSSKNDALLVANNIQVPYDFNNPYEIILRPYFSLLLVVNNDAATIAETLDSLLAQDYKYHEVIIIDNASTDGSRAICRQKIAGRRNVTFKKLHTKAKNAKAWNIALGMAKGLYVSFLKGNDRFLANALTTLYFVTERRPDVIAPFVYLEENASGSITIADKKYSVKRDAKFPDEKQSDILTKEAQDAAKLLFNQQINSILSMKLFYRQFLEENKIKFDKLLDDANAELFFQLETFFKAKFLLYASKALYIAPKNN